MAHVLISCVGSAGDVHPFLAIGRALAQRGHRVEVLTSPYFRARIERAGLAFVPVGLDSDFIEVVADPDLWHPRRSLAAIWRHLRGFLREGYERIAERATPTTVLAGGALAWHGRFAQEKLGLPNATVHLSRYGLLSMDDPAVGSGLGWLRLLPAPLAWRIVAVLERRFVDPMIRTGLDAVRAEIGLPPMLGPLRTWLNSPQRVICAFPSWFGAPQRDWPPETVVTDFARWPARPGEQLAPALAQFLDAGPPPIGITPGSAMAHGGAPIRGALAACVALGRRAVVVTPFRDQLPALPVNVHVIDYVPFDLLLPRLEALVHHGGVGTIAQAFAAGVPQVIAPHAHDQLDNAALVRRLGAGTTVAPDARAGRWVAALQAACAPAIRACCAEIARREAATPPGGIQIAQLIEALVMPV